MPKSKSTPVRPADADTASPANDVILIPLSQLQRSGLFCLSRSVGILAHAWEQTQQGGRNKGPIPRQYIWTYDGPPERAVPAIHTDGPV